MDIHDLLGTWHVHYSNFPMWLKGNKTQPKFIYSNYDSANRRFDDTVEYLQNGNSKTIKGKDAVLDEHNTKFLWRGNGLLFFVTSKWEIIEVENDLALIYFKKTLFTPEGYDVISRYTRLSQEQNALVERWKSAYGIPEFKNILDANFLK